MHKERRCWSMESFPPSKVTLHPHADAGPTEGDHAGDLQAAAALCAHQAVPRPQATLGAAAATATV